MKIKERLKKSGGFTLIEMLIVVAIIAILVAVSIPMVSSNLNEAKDATDEANERAAKAAAMITYMTSETEIAEDATYNYDAAKGILVAKETEPTGYGQCSDHKDDYIQVKFEDATPSDDTDDTLVPNLTWTGDGSGTTGTAHGDKTTE